MQRKVPGPVYCDKSVYKKDEKSQQDDKSQWDKGMTGRGDDWTMELPDDGTTGRRDDWTTRRQDDRTTGRRDDETTKQNWYHKRSRVLGPWGPWADGNVKSGGTHLALDGKQYARLVKESPSCRRNKKGVPGVINRGCSRRQLSVKTTRMKIGGFKGR